MKIWKIALALLALLASVSAFSDSALAYNVSGTVNYSGTKTGRIYVCLDAYHQYGRLGTSVASAGGTFTIRGVPDGNLHLPSWTRSATAYGTHRTLSACSARLR